MSSNTLTSNPIVDVVEETLADNGLSHYRSQPAVRDLVKSLVEREQGIAEEIIDAVVEQFGTDRDLVIERLSDTGMIVPEPEPEPEPAVQAPAQAGGNVDREAVAGALRTLAAALGVNLA